MVLEEVFAAPVPVSGLKEIVGDPLTEPHLVGREVAAVVRKSKLGDPLQALARQFRQGIGCAIHLKGCHDCSVVTGPTPHAMVHQASNSVWRYNALVTLGIMEFLGLKPVAFNCENGGQMFVNLVAQPTGEGRLAETSIEEMVGHTDLLNQDFAFEYTSTSPVSPAPEYVVLTGLRNPESTGTYLTPLSSVLAALSSQTIDELQKPQFVMARQPSVGPEFDYTAYDRPVLGIDPYAGYVIRYSRSKVTAESSAANAALDELALVVPRVRQNVMVAPGDILIINNRTAIHGRESIATTSERWLLRGYGYNAATKGRSDPAQPFVMRCIA